MKRRLVVAGALAGLVAAAAGGAWLWFLHRMGTPVDPRIGDVEVLIDEGASFDRAIGLLSGHGLVRDPLLFDLRARQRHRRVPLAAGLYRFGGRMTPDEIMDKLAAGPDTPLAKLPLRFQVIPGENVFQARAKLAGLLVPGDLMDVASDVKLLRKLQLPVPAARPAGAHTLIEGYLYPDTYFLLRKKPRLDLAVRLATTRFGEVFRELKVAHARSYARLAREHRLTDHDFVTMASLVQKEVTVDAEAPLVAAVFYNRLRRGMKLETDPTMVYGPDTWQETPSPRHRRDGSNPYNTYQHRGLPPGPICNPGRWALRAALDPADSPALYFVAMRDGTGRHAFATTYPEHEANVDRYLRKRPSEGRK